MKDIIRFECLENKLVEVNGALVLLDRDVAELYGVETKVLNQNVKNNIELFPENFRYQLSQEQYEVLRSSEMTLKKGRGQHSKYIPYVFTEEGLYMVATILRSEVAKQVHFHIIKTFSNLRKLNRNINTIIKIEDEPKQKSLMEQSNEILDEVLEIVFEESDDKNALEIETKIELNLGIYKKTKTTKQKGIKS